MPLATGANGILNVIEDCYITIPGAAGQGPSLAGTTQGTTIKFTVLPEVSDSKSASYNDEPIIGRATPLKTYSHSDNRSITMHLQFFATTDSELATNMMYLRALQSALYPRFDSSGAPFIPPPVCSIKCGEQLAKVPVCAVLKNCSVKFPTDVAMQERTLIPYKFDVDTTWEVVYKNTDLPGQDRIFSAGV